jgi:hypothetical protein
MNRLRRFYEKVPYGQASSRVAFAAFKAGEAILANPLLKEAILKGCAFEKAKNDWHKVRWSPQHEPANGLAISKPDRLEVSQSPSYSGGGIDTKVRLTTAGIKAMRPPIGKPSAS